MKNQIAVCMCIACLLGASFAFAQSTTPNHVFPPLAVASANGQLEMVQEQIKAGADVNASSADGMNALAMAILFNHADIVKALLQAGANPSATMNDGYTMLMLAAEFSDNHNEFACNIEVMELLLAAGVDVNAKSDDGTTALDLAIRNDSFPSCRQKKVSMLKAAGAQ